MSPSDPPVAAPTPPPFRDDGRTPNTPHDYADDPETGCCLVCGWYEATHHGSRVATPTPETPSPMTFQRFSIANRERCGSPHGFNHRLDAWSTSDWFVAVIGELGEAANVVKKLNRVRDGMPGNKETPDALRDKLRQELGDAFVYLDLIAQSLGFLIADAAVEVFDKKSVQIGYPDPPLAGAVSQSQPEVKER